MKFVILLVVLSVAHSGLSIECYNIYQTSCQKFDTLGDKVPKLNCSVIEAGDKLLEYECGFLSYTLKKEMPCSRTCMPKGSCAALEASSKVTNVTCYTCSDDLCNKNSAVSNQVAAVLLLPIVTVFYMYY